MASVGDPYKVNIAAEGFSPDKIAESLSNISDVLEGVTVAAGLGAKVLVLSAVATVPVGTAAGTVIVRTVA